MLKITILYGAIRKGRMSICAVMAVETALKATHKAEISIIDIKDHNLPVMEERFIDMENPGISLQDISVNLLRADGILFITPEYNNSYSGAIKNTVDYFTNEWSRKPIGIVTVSDGIQGGLNASNLLQLLVLAIDGYAMPFKLLIPEVDKNLDRNGVPQTDKMDMHIKSFVNEFLWFTEAIANQKKKDQES